MPEGIEAQMDQKHDKKKRHTDIGKSDLLMIEKPAKQKARQKIRQREADFGTSTNDTMVLSASEAQMIFKLSI